MKLVLFPSAFHPSLGGVEELTRQLAHAYRKDGHEVMVVTEQWPRRLPSFEWHEGIAVRRFPMRVPAGCWKSNLTFALSHHWIRSRITRCISQFDADILHVQCVSSTTLYALHVRRVFGVPLVVTLQGELTMDAAGIFQRPGIAQKIMTRALKEADFITACSKHTLREAEAFHERPFGERARVVYNGISMEEFEEVEPHVHRRPYVFAIGRHVRAKGFDVLLQAFAEVMNLGFDLLLAGDGPEHTALRKLASDLNLNDKVHFLGRADRPLVARLFKGCTFFVLPSRHEPFGIVNLEAMAAGRAIVATRVGGVPEIVEDEVNGLLVGPEHVSELAAAMRRMMLTPELRQAVGSAGGTAARDYDWPALALKYFVIYRSLIRHDQPMGMAA